MRLATFNCENLFGRYRFKKNAQPVKDDGFTINQTAFEVYQEDEKKITAQAIKEVKADVIALQEVESLPVLDRFYTQYLKSLGYIHRILVDGNDNRQIDVAVLSRHPFTAIRTHRHERGSSRGTPLFSRDCLEVEVDVQGKPLLLYVNHLKSMIGGRDKTRPRRLAQARRVAEIVEERWLTSQYRGNFVVLGDMNDYPGPGGGLDPLLSHPGLVNVLERLPEDERWTHFYGKGKEYRQLDYLLLSSVLAQANPQAPAVMRKGMPLRAVRYAGKRFAGVGKDNPKASDHAPLYMDLELL